MTDAHLFRPGGQVTAAQVVSDNLSDAWINALTLLATPGIVSFEPLVVTVEGFTPDSRPTETVGVRPLINRHLQDAWRSSHNASRNKTRPPASVDTTASTIFPESLWQPGLPRAELYTRYLKILPWLRRCPPNRHGIYFERLIAFGRGPNGGNQLEQMLTAYDAGVRRVSAYQAIIADPARDSKLSSLLGFPCLQQVAVHPSPSRGSLSLTGFYGTQYLFQRGYGNYLGLCRLGRFLAIEMGLQLDRVTCVASHVPVEGGFGKATMRALIGELEAIS